MTYDKFVSFLSTGSSNELISYYWRTVEWRRKYANNWVAEVQSMVSDALLTRFPGVLGEAPESWDIPWDPTPKAAWEIPELPY